MHATSMLIHPSVTETSHGVSVLCCYSPIARVVSEVPFCVPHGMLVQQAIAWLQHELNLSDSDVHRYGVWGRPVDAASVLASGDRLEFYRPLTVDPKVARRQRFKKQGAKRSGLFAKRRPGAVAGY